MSSVIKRILYKKYFWFNALDFLMENRSTGIFLQELKTSCLGALLCISYVYLFRVCFFFSSFTLHFHCKFWIWLGRSLNLCCSDASFCSVASFFIFILPCKSMYYCIEDGVSSWLVSAIEYDLSDSTASSINLLYFLHVKILCKIFIFFFIFLYLLLPISQFYLPAANPL